MSQIKVFILGILIVIFILITASFSVNLLSWLNLVMLTATLIVLIWYAYDTNRIANQTIETNLRPVILRSGYLEKWDNVASTENSVNLKNNKIIYLKILKNIAKDIEGYFFLKNKKYKLLFANEITRIEVGEDSFSYLEKWAWMGQDAVLSAIYNSNSFETTQEKDGIYIKYRDIEGNAYFTRENENFSQSSGKL
jgi:Ca2+/Na+ antiporter